MKKLIVSVLKSVGEKAAEVPITIQSWPGRFHQPEMPAALRQKMEEQNKKYTK